MTQFQGSFVLSREIEDDEAVHMSDIRARAMASTDPARPEFPAFFQNIRSPVLDDAHSPASLSSDDEDDDGLQESQTTTRMSVSDDPYDSNLDSDDDKGRRKNRTAKSLYLSRCKHYGVVPSSTFISLIDAPSECIDIRHAGLKPIDIKVMIPSLKMSTTVTKLDLSGNGFGSVGAIYLAKSIKFSKQIAELVLSYNDIGLTGTIFKRRLARILLALLGTLRNFTLRTITRV
jgi:hypothetical protein